MKYRMRYITSSKTKKNFPPPGSELRNKIFSKYVKISMYPEKIQWEEWGKRRWETEKNRLNEFIKEIMKEYRDFLLTLTGPEKIKLSKWLGSISLIEKDIKKLIGIMLHIDHIVYRRINTIYYIVDPKPGLCWQCQKPISEHNNQAHGVLGKGLCCIDELYRVEMVKEPELQDRQEECIDYNKNAYRDEFGVLHIISLSRIE